MSRRRTNKRARYLARRKARRKARARQSRISAAAPTAPPLDLLFEDECSQAATLDLRHRIRDLDPISTTARLAGLLTFPELGANACRLEALIREVLQHARGEDQIDGKQLQQLFQLVGDMGHGRLEDPAEDVFVSLVVYESRNYRVFEGLYEGNAFYLQRFIDAVGLMPSQPPFDALRKRIRNLLTLSEMIAERSEVTRYTAGEEFPRDAIPATLEARLDSLAGRVRISANELAEIGISSESIRPYLASIPPSQRRTRHSLANIDLERTPILHHHDAFYVLLPSSISSAIRLDIIAFCRRRNELAQLHAAIANTYSKMIHETSVLGSIRELPLRWIERDDLLVSDCVAEVDPGRFVHFVFATDDFSDADRTGLGPPGNAMSRAGDLIWTRVRSTARQFRNRSGFRQGISLIVTCGWGRAVSFGIPNESEPQWRSTFISADQLITLSRVHRMTPLILFRLLDHVEALEDANIRIRNINGLLNLYAWAEECGRDLLPHGQIEPEMVQGPGPLQLMITQNALYRLRARVAQDHDLHVASPPTGRAVEVSRYETRPYFSDDVREPLYASHDDLIEGRLRSVYEGAHLTVWLTTSFDGSTDRDTQFTIWDAFSKWLPVVIPIVEKHAGAITHTNFQWHISFPAFDPHTIPEPDLTATVESLTEQLITTAEPASGSVHLRVPDAVYSAFHRPDNFAEKAVLNSLICASTQLLGLPLDNRTVLDEAINTDDAKQFHSFTARNYADFVADHLPSKPLMLEEFDESMTRLGLAWHTRSPTAPLVIEGIDECTTFLNETINAIWKGIRTALAEFDKQAMILWLLSNLEALRREDRVWDRTARAMFALYGKSEKTHQRIAEQGFRRNASIVNSRLLIEMALAECTLVGGATPGQLDVARLLSKLSVLTQMGGWSDAIREEAMKAEVTISAVGVIEVEDTFHHQIMMPFGFGFAAQQQTRAARKYDEMFVEAAPVPSTTHLFEPEFQAAWLAEFGFEIDEGRRYLDDIENHGRTLERPVFVLRRSELLAVRSDLLSPDTVTCIMDALTLVPREHWDVPPIGFTMKDIVPWRYRRRLSAIYRPLLQLENCDDPPFVIAPSFIREAFGYRLDRSYRAEFDTSHYSSTEMKAWVGRRRDDAGHGFNQEVASKLTMHGWKCEAEVRPTALGINVKDRDYGDIDVLAWDSSRGRVVAIECKDLLFAKTPGEIARQLAEFRGQVDKNGRPDRLRRHLDRIDLLREHQTSIERYTGVSSATVESAVVFRNLVPIQFSDIEELKNAHVTTLAALDRL